MPSSKQRFFFHVHNREDLRDEEGTEFATVAEAQSYAIKVIRSLLREELSEGRFDLRGYIEITDAAGRVVLNQPYAGAVQVYMDR